MAFNGAGIRDTARTPKVGINTCLDTNEFIRRYDLVIDELLDATDLVDARSELDLKQTNDDIHQSLGWRFKLAHVGMRSLPGKAQSALIGWLCHCAGLARR